MRVETSPNRPLAILFLPKPGERHDYQIPAQLLTNP
jgi:hypothetical protein